MQYISEVQIGGQWVRALPDTGSYDLVVFGRHCLDCAGRRSYNSDASISFVRGLRTREQNYGSGSCMARDGRDRLAVGPFTASNLSLWEATHCELPLLRTGGFDAVAGLGPPGHAKRIGLSMLEDIRRIERKYRWSHKALPENIQQAKDMFLQDVLEEKPTLLEAVGVTTFSMCFGRRPGSPGWLVWNDTRPAGSVAVTSAHHADFTSPPVDWGVHLKGASLLGLSPEPVQLGCESAPNCYAVLDSGTSLLGVPSSVYEAVLAELNKDDAPDCGDLSKFPDLVLNLGGHELRFPPEAYIGILEGDKSNLLARFLHSDDVGARMGAGYVGSGGQCQLLLLDNGNATAQDGTEEFVLGAPFFREYYTTFDIGRPMLGQPRSISVTPAGDRCQPLEPAHQGFVYRRERGPVLPRRVDASQLRLPSRWLRRLMLEEH